MTAPHSNLVLTHTSHREKVYKYSGKRWLSQIRKRFLLLPSFHLDRITMLKCLFYCQAEFFFGAFFILDYDSVCVLKWILHQKSHFHPTTRVPTPPFFKVSQVLRWLDYLKLVSLHEVSHDSMLCAFSCFLATSSSIVH